MITTYICKYKDKSKEDRPFCNGSKCSDVCIHTTDPEKALYEDHRCFRIIGDKLREEVERA